MQKSKEDKRNLREDFKIFCRAIKIHWQICPQYLIWMAVKGIMGAIRPYFGIYMSAQLVNELAGDMRAARLVLLALITLLGNFLINIIYNRLIARVDIVWSHSSWKRQEMYFSDCQNSMPYVHIEDPETRILRENIFEMGRAVGGGLSRVIWSFSDIINNIADIIASAALSMSIFNTVSDSGLSGFTAFANSAWAGLLLIILIAVYSVLSARLRTKNSVKTEKEWESIAENNIFVGVYSALTGEDVTIFNMKKILLPLYKKKLVHPRFLVNIKKIDEKYALILNLLKFITDFYLFAFVGAKAFIGAVGIGNYIIYRQAFSRLMNAIQGIASTINKLRFNNKYLLRIYKYLDLPDEMYHGTLAVEKRDDIDYEIEFRNVSFKYPRTEEFALRNVNMKFNIGDKLAIVGENGSGKTTFIKLLCRLYDPTEGQILLNGIDITRYRYDEYIKLFSVVFQDFMLFDFSIAANVSASHDYDEQKVYESLSQVGMSERVKGLKKGIETMLYKGVDDDGMDVSKGEAQKIALARALYKDAPFVILDEPTAALDPVAEALVYADFNRLVENKTSVFISHRLSSCRFCDDIAVFEKGSIIQRGSHDVLVADENGEYYRLWQAQAQYYV